MFLGWIYEYIFAVAVLAILLGYNVYCFIGLIKINKALKNSSDIQDIKTKFNIYAWVIKRRAKSGKGKAKLTSKIVRGIHKAILLANAIALIINVVLLSVIYLLNIQATNISNIITTLFGDADCSCYAKCTSNEEDDAKTAYELLFGPDEYSKFCDSIVVHLSEKQVFIDLVANGSGGKEQGEWLIAHLDDNALQCYKAIVGNNNKFRAGDHQDRSKMTNEELRQDLIALLKDYKVGGRNPNCDRCFDTEDYKLGVKCLGEAHYVPGWTWEAIWDSDNPGDGSQPDPGEGGGGGGGSVAAENSQYGIQLNDGWYFWYHQSSHQCDNNASHPTYGRYSSLIIGGANISGNVDTAVGRGCSTYATAMALSNVLGKEITPWQVVLDVIKVTPQEGSSGYYVTHDGSRGIRMTTELMQMNKAELAASCVEVYGSSGLEAKKVGTSQSEVDEILSKGGMVVYSYGGGPSPYYSGAGHFMTIRYKDSNGLYYLLNSSAYHDIAQMNTGITWSTLSSAIKNGAGVGFWNNNPPSSGGGGGGGELTVEGAKVKQLLSNSEFADKAEALAYTYSVVQPVLGTNAAIGLMANVANEGNFGVVEHAFSKNHAYGFSLPSGGSIVKNMSDVDYLLAWDSTTTSGSPKKGSCGFGCVQWSYGRRITLANIYKSMSSGDVISDIVKLEAEVKMMGTELSPGTSYYNSVSKAASQYGGSPEVWAEAFCDYYEMPGGWCGKSSRMSGSGSGCITRRNTATRLSQILSGN